MKFELCAASFEAIDLAVEYKLNRIELCQSLEQGGITPSVGMIEYALSKKIETHVLIRPRSGNFIFSEEEVAIMCKDIQECKDKGVDGVVIGALNERYAIDIPAVEKMIEAAAGMELTFHRAFDDCVQWEKTVEGLIELNFKRILTSGLSRTVDQGINLLEEIVKLANGRIEIMAGGGVNPNNVSKLMKDVKVSAIHFSATKKVQDEVVSIFSEPRLVVDKIKMEKIIAAQHV